MGQFDQDNTAFDTEGLARHIEKALRVEPPTGTLEDLGWRTIKALFNPVVLGAENLPEEPCLFVGNHSLLALDGAVVAPTLYHEHGRFLRSLGDRFLWSDLTEKQLLGRGAVLGHPEVCSALMEAGEDLMVFPGGAHEATKTTAQKYTLQWKERYGFVKLAAKHGYTIIPMAIVGPDEFYGHWMEGEDLPDSQLGRWLQKIGLLSENTRADLLPPIPSGLLGSLLPKPQRCYLQLGEPISLRDYSGKRLTKKQLATLRSGVAEQIESMLVELLRYREQHRGSDGMLRRLLTL